MLREEEIMQMPLLLRIILSENDDDNLRNLSLTKAVATLSTSQLLSQLTLLDNTFRRSKSNNLYQRVRALFFLYAVHRFHLPERRRLIEKKRRRRKTKSSRCEADDAGNSNNNNNRGGGGGGNADETFICPKGYSALLDRRFDEAIDYFLEWVSSSSSTLTLSANDDDDEYDDNINKDEKGPRPRGGGDGGGYYPVPRTTSLISNLTFSRDGPLVIATATAGANNDNMASTSSSSSSNRGYYPSNNNGSSSLFSSTSSHISEEAVPPTITSPQQQQQQQQQILLLPSEATSSALAKSYRSLAFQTLADQVKRSVRSHDGNEWMFNVTNGSDTPLFWSEELLVMNNGEIGCEEKEEEDENEKKTKKKNAPMLVEKTPVRMDLSHVSSSIYFFMFFLSFLRFNFCDC
jgi:hypothetical protein